MTSRRFSGIVLLVFLLNTMTLASSIQKVQCQGPVPVISTFAPDPVNSDFEITIDFDATVDASVFPLLNYSNCGWSDPQSVSGDDSVWSLQIAPIVDGEVTVLVPAGIYQDAASNWNLESNPFSRTYDGSSPVPVISTFAPDPVNSDFEITIDFDATVDASVFPLLNYSNCDWSNPQSVSGDDSIWTLQITPTTDDEVTVQVPAGIYQDDASNWNIASNLFSITYDAQSPVPMISSLAPDPTNSAFEVTIDFDASVDASVFPLLNYSNCGWSDPQSISGDDSTWTLQITPTTNGQVNVWVPAGIYQDAASNWNLESNLFSITYAPHDIAITNVVPFKPVVGQGYSLNINVTAANQGDYTESFNVTVYANTTIIETKTNVTLTSGNSTTLIFTWNTTGFSKGNYTIWAYASPILGETNLDNNNCTDGWILITKVGDLGGKVPPEFFSFDDQVDGKDLNLFLQCYRHEPQVPAEAMLLADLGGLVPPEFFSCDGEVDGKDLALFLLCFKGQGPPDP